MPGPERSASGSTNARSSDGHDYGRVDKSDKRQLSALEVLDRGKLVEDPLERVQRLEHEVMERRAFQLRAKGVLAEIRRLFNSLEAEFEDREAKK